MNFLAQVRGRKLVRLWDRDVMSEEEKEQLFTRYDLGRPAYREELEKRAMNYELGPGLGVHQPCAELEHGLL